MEKILNPHCETPFINKDGVKWYIQFWYKNSIGKRLPFKKAYQLNKQQYLEKRKDIVVEINKTERKHYASELILQLREELSIKHFNAELGCFEHVDKTELPFASFLDDYIEFSKNDNGTEDSSIKVYASRVNVIKEYLTEIGQHNIPLKDVTKEFVEKFLVHTSQNSSTANRDNYCIFIKAVFNYLVDQVNILPKSPIKVIKAKITKKPSERHKPYTIELLKQVLANQKSLSVEFYLLQLFQYYTLSRPSELLCLQLSQFDFENNRIIFSDTKTNVRKDSKVSKEAMKYLKSLIPDNTPLEYYFLGNAGKKSNSKKGQFHFRVFGEYQNVLDPYQTKFQTIRKQMELDPNHTIYSMKHSGVVHLLEADWSIKEIMDYTGHKNESTLGIYAREYKPKQRERLDDVLV